MTMGARRAGTIRDLCDGCYRTGMMFGTAGRLSIVECPVCGYLLSTWSFHGRVPSHAPLNSDRYRRHRRRRRLIAVARAAGYVALFLLAVVVMTGVKRLLTSDTPSHPLVYEIVGVGRVRVDGITYTVPEGASIGCHWSNGWRCTVTPPASNPTTTATV